MKWWSHFKRRSREAPEATGEEAPAPRTSTDKTSSGWWSNKRGLRLLQALACLAALSALFFAVRPPASTFIRSFVEGDTSDRLITADFDFEYFDPVLRSERQLQEAAKVAPIFKRDDSPIFEAQQKLKDLREQIPDIETAINEQDIQTVSDILQNLDIKLENKQHAYVVADITDYPKSVYESLIYYRNNTRFWEILTSILQDIQSHGLVEDINLVEKPQRTARELLELDPNYTLGYTILDDDGNENRILNISGLYDFQKMDAAIDKTLQKDYPTNQASQENLARRELGRLLILALMDRPTLVYLDHRTEMARRQAREDVPEVRVQVNRYDTIIGKSQRIDRVTALKLKAYQERSKLSWQAEVGCLLLALLPLSGMLLYVRRYHPSVFASPRQLAVLLGALAILVAMARIAAYGSRLNPNLEQLGIAVPAGALGLVVTILVSGRLAVIFVATGALFIGLIFGAGSGEFALDSSLVAFWTGLIAILTVRRVKRRSDLYRAGLAVAGVACLFVCGFRLMQSSLNQDPEVLWQQLRWGLTWGVLNGALSSILSIALLPILEDLLGVITDIKLLELSRKTELLQRLEREAPGSYQHTMAVATLAESAAEVIGADSLLTRVGTYYHDIGKMLKPEYFVENQETAADRARHAKLKPQMSVLVIRNHVKHGLELAKEYGIPKIIADFIPQHHGTMLLKYFYHRILKDEPEEQIREDDFRYPGPKPRRKETAIVMMADAMEAAARVLEDKSEGGIRQFVRGIIHDRLEDGQFDECNLTLAELRTLEDSFCDTLHHMMHQRITYPSRPAPIRAVDREIENANEPESMNSGENGTASRGGGRI